jgi:hypothetical protein
MLRYRKHNTFYWYIFYYNRLHWIWGVDRCLTESKVSHTWVIYATYILNNFHVQNVHLDNNQVFSPTDAKLNRLKNNFKFVLKLTLKSTYVFRCENTILRDHTPWSLLKLQLLKWVKIHWYGSFGGAAAPPNEPRRCILTHFNNWNFSKDQTVWSLRMVFSHRNT